MEDLSHDMGERKDPADFEGLAKHVRLSDGPQTTQRSLGSSRVTSSPCQGRCPRILENGSVRPPTWSLFQILCVPY